MSGLYCVQQLPHGRPIQFPDKPGLLPSDRGREAATTAGGRRGTSAGGGESSSTGKEDSPECRGSISPASSGSSHMFPLEFTRSHCFPINTLI